MTWQHRSLLAALVGVFLLGGMRVGGESDTVPGAGGGSAPVRACQETSWGETSNLAPTLRGLVAWNCGADDAFEILTTTAGETAWEDWRLWALARSVWPRGEHLEPLAEVSDQRLTDALRAAEGLLALKASPLRPLAYPLSAALHRSRGDHLAVLALIERSRSEALDRQLRTELDVMAWEAAVELDMAGHLEAQARELLVVSPLEAEELGVIDVLRLEDGSIPWQAHFTAVELLLRATHQLDAELPEEALETLALLTEDQRGFDWHLLEAAALIDARRGPEAVETLARAEAPDRTAAIELEWLRAEAALDAATVRRGRTNLPASERESMRDRAHQHLWHLIRQGGDSARAADALRLLFEELADGEHFDQVRSLLVRLRELDPGDTSGGRYLWRLGWGEYRQRNYTGAIGYWSHLIDIYPETKLARAGSYWKARAYGALGDQTRSSSLFREVAAAPSNDYYGSLAREQLGLPPRTADPLRGTAANAWPSDPLLARAEVMSEHGLDEFALLEIDQLSGAAGIRAEQALRSRVLARQGQRRDSIQHLWRAFPMLGSAFQDEAPPEALRMYYPLDFRELVERYAADNDLPVSLLLAMIRQESAFDVTARSWAGARGLMQVMPATAKELAERMGLRFSTQRLNEPSFSIQLGSRYFRQVLDMFDGRLELALAGYNAGPYRIRRLVREAGSGLEIDTFLEDLKYEESRTYVQRIVLFSDSYERLYPGLG